MFWRGFSPTRGQQVVQEHAGIRERAAVPAVVVPVHPEVKLGAPHKLTAQTREKCGSCVGGDSQGVANTQTGIIYTHSPDSVGADPVGDTTPLMSQAAASLPRGLTEQSKVFPVLWKIQEIAVCSPALSHPASQGSQHDAIDCY